MKNYILTLSLAVFAAIVLLSSCKKTDPTQEPVTLLQENARIRLIADGIEAASIDIEENGTYIAEFESSEEKYEGLDEYIHLPFVRVPVDAKSNVVTYYRQGSYSVISNSYDVSGVGKLYVDPNDYAFMFLENGGQKNRARYGILKATQNDGRSFNAVKAPGTYTVSSVSVNYSLNDEASKKADFNSCDLAEITKYLSENGFPELVGHLNKFTGYKVKNVAISSMNAIFFDFLNGTTIGGFWDLKEKQVTLNKTLDNKKKLAYSATYTPAVSGKTITLNIDMRVKIDDSVVYNVEAKLVLQ